MTHRTSSLLGTSQHHNPNSTDSGTPAGTSPDAADTPYRPTELPCADCPVAVLLDRSRAAARRRKAAPTAGSYEVQRAGAAAPRGDTWAAGEGGNGDVSETLDWKNSPR